MADHVRGEIEAARTLLSGLLREVGSRADRGEITAARDVDAIWRDVARENPELIPDGFRNFVLSKMPESAWVFDETAIHNLK